MSVYKDVAFKLPQKEYSAVKVFVFKEKVWPDYVLVSESKEYILFWENMSRGDYVKLRKLIDSFDINYIPELATDEIRELADSPDWLCIFSRNV